MPDTNRKNICTRILKRIWKYWLLEHLVFPIVVALAVLYIGASILNPPSLPDIHPEYIYSTMPPTQKVETPFKLELQYDNFPWIIITAFNKGNCNDEDIDIEFRLLKNNKIMSVEKRYSPLNLERRVQASEKNNDIFYERLSTLPSLAGVEYKFNLEGFIKSNDDFEYSVLSKYKNWSKSTKIKPRDLSSHISFGNVAFALDEKSEKINKEKELSKSEPTRSGILIGGYDPLIMSNELFKLLQRKILISQEQAMNIKTDIESYKKGVLFGGVNILKLNELILNSLISNKAITIEQANVIVAKSKNSGGVLIGGYNVIILQVGILDSLFKNGNIEMKEGQKVIDQAKAHNN